MPELICPTCVIAAPVLWWALCRGAARWNPPREESEKEGL